MSLQHTEKQEPEISLIIPIYNGCRYIDRLIGNVKSQTFKDYEILFIDDGSLDGSFEKIAEYINGSDIKIHIYKQQNKGQGEARNLGIERACGKWLCFMDQDDAIEPDYLERLYDEAENKNGESCDILISGYRKYSIDNHLLECVRFTNNEWCRYMNIAPWGKLYRREFIVKNNLKCLPFILGEDIYFNVCCYMNTKKICYTDYAGYLWIMNNESVSHSVHKQATKEVSILILFDYLSNVPGFEKWKNEDMNAYFMLKTGIYHILYSAAGTDSDMLIRYEYKVFKWLNEHIRGIENNRLISLRTPVGERMRIRFIVFTYMICRKIKLNKLLLRILCRVRQIGTPRY